MEAGDLPEDLESLKSKISSNLNNLNQRSTVFDDIIKDYNILYKKYTEIQLRNEGNQRMNKVRAENLQDKEELEKLKEDYLTIKKANEEYIEKTNKYIQDIMNLKQQLEIKEKRITGYFTENGALKQQNYTLDKNNKELSEINKNNIKKIADLEKGNQKYQIDHRKLIDIAGKMHMEIQKLKNQILELQEHSGKKPETIKNEKPVNAKHSVDLKIPKQLIYKQKIHQNGITNINFNKSGSSYLTIGEDSNIHVYDSTKNKETNSFNDNSKKFIGACYDHKEELIFAGVDDRTAKLWSLKNNELLNTFSGHNNDLNCIKSFNCNEYGLTGSSDIIKQWDFNTRNLMRKFKSDKECHSMDIEPNDSFILCGQLDGTVKMWGTNDEQEKCFSIHKDKVINIKIINNDSFLTLGKDKTIKLFDMKNEKVLFTIDESKIPDINERSIAVSPDKKCFAVGSNKGFIYFVNINDGKIIGNFNNGSVTTLNWNPNNSLLYIGDPNGFLSIWK